MLIEKGVHFLASAGAIGVGKTSLAKIIAERWNAMFIEENFEENSENALRLNSLPWRVSAWSKTASGVPCSA